MSQGPTNRAPFDICDSKSVVVRIEATVKMPPKVLAGAVAGLRFHQKRISPHAPKKRLNKTIKGKQV